jgi:hypothetical protein
MNPYQRDACSIVDDELKLRLGAELAEKALKRPHVLPMDFTGRPMRGMVRAAPEALRGKRSKPGCNRPPASRGRRFPSLPGKPRR